MLGSLFQFGYFVNYVMILIETSVSLLIIFFIAKIVNKPLLEEKGITKKKRTLTITVTSIVVLGIVLALRYIFGYLGFFIPFFRLFGSGVPESFDQIEFFFFAIIVSIFFPLYKVFFNKFCKEDYSNRKLQEFHAPKKYIKRSVSIIVISWVVACIFLSIDLLDIDIGHLIPPDPLNPDYDVFLLGFEWAFFTIIIDVSLTILINKILPIEKRLSREVLNNAVIIGALLSFSAWSLQLIIVELYLVRFFELNLYNQDIRILFAVVTAIYLLSFYISLKFKFAPEASKKSMKDIQFALQLEKTDKMQGSSMGEQKIILNVEDLTTYFYTEEGIVRAVDGVSFSIYEGEVLGLVGETGCGKSVTALSILQLIRPPGKIEKGKIKFGDIDLHEKTEIEILPYRGSEITMIFQDPLNSLNPVFKVGNQISEVFLLHKRNELLVEASKNQNDSIYSVARERSQQILKELNIPAPKQVFDRYPHELSGGMRQRVQIAMALVCSPKLLIADEPTTALDVTVQNQILKLMKDLKNKYNTSILFITHDLGIISKMCNRVAVMYSGT
ncbi:MAG: ABC transporter ATP-binding protein, partial [Promethearchaeota archaeon]